MWLSRVAVQETAGALKYDLAIDQSGSGEPSIEDAGFTVNGLKLPDPPGASGGGSIVAFSAVVAMGLLFAATVGLAMGRARPRAS